MSIKYIFIIILIILGLVAGFYIWFQSDKGLDLGLEAPSEIASGVPFELKVNFSNNSGAVLDNARLTLVLPEGAVFFGSDPDKTIDNKILGNVGSGGMIQETYKIIVFSSEEAVKDFKATLDYSPASIGARFEKSESLGIKVKSSGIAVEMALPEKIISGDEFEISVAYRNVSDFDFSGLELKLEFPPSFTFISSSLKPDSNNSVWRLGDLRSNSEGKFTVKGSIIGSEGDVFDFKSFLSMSSSGFDYPVNQTVAQTSIASSPLSISINLSNGSDYVAVVGDTLNFTVGYINKSDISLKNVVIRAQLAGEMFDISTVQTRGIFRSSDNMLVWNQSVNPELTSVSSGSAGMVNFSVKLKGAYPIRRFSDKNFILRISAEAESPTVPEGMNAAKLLSKARLETKVNGDIKIDARAYFRDADSGILNNGSIPPKVGQPTNFTIHWLIKNYGNSVSNVVARAALGNNVKMVGAGQSNAGAVPNYDSAANEVVLKIDKLQANQGVIGSPVDVVFQIEATPLNNQIGAYMPLIGETTIKATDDFTGKELTGNDVAITTALPDDNTIGSQGGVVQP